MRICFILGTAAELIKILPVIREVDARQWTWHGLSTGQSPVGLRRQWLDFGLPEEKLQTAVLSEKDLASSFAAFNWFCRAWWVRPEINADFALVHGDTLSTLAGAQWGKRARIPVVHVEAGLRSSQLFSPFPEEICRRWVSRKASLHMAPDAWASGNLHRAGFSKGVVNTGANTLADAVKGVLGGEKSSSDARYAIVNIHRFENLNSNAKWQFIAEVLLQAAEKMQLRIVMHAPTELKIEDNPVWKSKLQAHGAQFLPRQPFSTFVRQLADAQCVITDGGSNQEECFYLGKPCLILRGETERREGLGENCVLAKWDKAIVDDFLSAPQRFSRSVQFPAVSPSRVICDELENSLGKI